MTRRHFSQVSTLCIGARLVSANTDEPPKTLLSLGLLTDVHYADKDQAGSRAYRKSLTKAAEAALLFKEKQPAAIVCLGDLIDAAPKVDLEITYLRAITEVLKKSTLPRYNVLGNHCVATLTKEEFFKHADTVNKTGHYSCDLGGIHLVILDACFNHKMEPYGRNNFKWDDANIPPAQRAWLEEDLKKTKNPVIVFAHQRLDLDRPKKHAVKQSSEVRKILEKSGKVKAVFQGHSHKNELQEINGIPYCTLAAMVEGHEEQSNSYSLLHILDNGTLKLEGFRRQENRVIGD